MSKEVVDELRQQEAGAIALSIKYHRWSQVMIEVMIREQEQKLVAVGLPVEDDGDQNFFWAEMA